MARFVNPLIVNNFIDANIMDNIADDEDEAVNRIVEIYENDELLILLPYSVQDELDHPNTPSHVRRAASKFLFSMPVTLTQQEREAIAKLIKSVKGDAESKNIERDLFHVAEAGKYGGYFITRDKRLLKRAEKIETIIGVNVVTPSKFLQNVAKARNE